MTKKDYQLIASILLPLFGMANVAERAVLELVARNLASRLYEDNVQFSAYKFLIACGAWPIAK